MLVRFAGVLWPLQLHLQSLGSNLESIHGLDGTLGREGVVKADEPEALAEVCVLVNEDFGADDAAEGLEHLNEVRVLDVVREMVYEEIAALGTCMCVCATFAVTMEWSEVTDLHAASGAWLLYAHTHTHTHTHDTLTCHHCYITTNGLTIPLFLVEVGGACRVSLWGGGLGRGEGGRGIAWEGGSRGQERYPSHSNCCHGNHDTHYSGRQTILYNGMEHHQMGQDTKDTQDGVSANRTHTGQPS